MTASSVATVPTVTQDASVEFTMEQPFVSGSQFLILMGIVCGMLIVGWLMAFFVVLRNKEHVRDLLAGSSFLQNLTVIGVVITTGCLAIVGVLKGELAATLLSGVVGYVLGSQSRSGRERTRMQGSEE